MRTLALGLLLSGCAVGDTLTSPAPIPDPDGLDGMFDPDVSRFARGAVAPDFGYGVVGDPSLDDVRVPRLWASMGDRLCAFEGDHGQLQEDVWVDDAPSPVEVDVIDADADGFVLLTPTQVVLTDTMGTSVRRFARPDPVVAGERLSDGRLALLVEHGGSCELSVGEERIVVHEGSCAVDADVEEASDALYFSTGGRVWAYDGELTVFAEADQVAVDPTTDQVFTGQTGVSSLSASIGNSTVSIDLGGPLIDMAARAGHAVALTSRVELVRIDSATAAVVDRQAYAGRWDRDRVVLSDNGQSLLLLGGDEVQFYRVRTDEQMRL